VARKAKCQRESLSDRVRRIADEIERLPSQLKEQFVSAKPIQERVQWVGMLETKVLADLFPIISWIERRASVDAASIFLRRVHFLFAKAKACARQDMIELTADTGLAGEISEGVREAAEMVVIAMACAALLRDWANDIEHEEKSRSSSGLREKQETATGHFSAKQRRTSRVTKEVELKGKAMLVRDAIYEEAQNDTGRSLSDILKAAGVTHKTFNNSRHFQEARDAWEGLKRQREEREHWRRRRDAQRAQRREDGESDDYWG